VLKSGGQPDEVYSGMWAAISKGDEWRGEFLNKKKDGELYWENAALSPIRNAVGEITNYLKVSEDITQRKMAEEALRKATEELGEKTKRLQELDKLKSKFISTVSHELRTPLSITKEGISLVMDGIAGPVNEKQKNILGTASRNIDRLARIINNLLDISKIEAGKVGLKREMCDAVAVVEQVAAAFKYNVEEKGLEMRRKYGAGKIDVYADSDRLAEIFTNLLGNSVKFAERGYIEIGVLDKGPGLECYVYDTGIGVKGEDLVRIFDRFYQPERELVGGEQGTGLGLAIAKELVELHGGRIYAESEYGKWTKVTFIIPRNGGTHG
jgi:signal transduction histidine kinase